MKFLQIASLVAFASADDVIEAGPLHGHGHAIAVSESVAQEIA